MPMSDDQLAMLIRIDTNVGALLKHESDHEKRIRALEKKQWLLSGGAVALSTLAAKMGFPWQATTG
jgi:hypothetical protein